MQHESRRLIHCADEAQDALGILVNRLELYGCRNAKAHAIQHKVFELYEEMQASHLDIEKVVKETEG